MIPMVGGGVSNIGNQIFAGAGGGGGTTHRRIGIEFEYLGEFASNSKRPQGVSQEIVGHV
jgi:hypothetical protein